MDSERWWSWDTASWASAWTDSHGHPLGYTLLTKLRDDVLPVSYRQDTQKAVSCNDMIERKSGWTIWIIEKVDIEFSAKTRCQDTYSKEKCMHNFDYLLSGVHNLWKINGVEACVAQKCHCTCATSKFNGILHKVSHRQVNYGIQNNAPLAGCSWKLPTKWEPGTWRRLSRVLGDLWNMLSSDRSWGSGREYPGP